MNAAAPTPALSEETLVAQYLTQLARLSPDARLELAARLLQTLKSGAPTGEPAPDLPKKTLLDFVGDWAAMPGTDEEIMASIRGARVSTRPEVSLD